METFVPLRAGGSQQEVACTFRAWPSVASHALPIPVESQPDQEAFTNQNAAFTVFFLLIRHLSTVATEEKKKTRKVNLRISLSLGYFQVFWSFG